MGMCMSAEQKKAEERSAQIERQLAADKMREEKTVKLLLLGAGESGKSTLVKQMKIIHGDGYSQAELASYRTTVCDNLVHSMRAVLEAMGMLRINLGNQANKIHVKSILSYVELDARQVQLPPDLSNAIVALWADTGVQQAYRRSNEYQLNDSAAYYFNAISRIAGVAYTPTQEDVLRARVRTTGIIETSFHYKNVVFRMFDVGGQRSERRKWIQCFDDVTAVLFVSALSGYDMKLYEDQAINRVHESLTLFDAICNNRFFTSTSMILFLNKTDLFRKKLQNFPLEQYFPDYNGPKDNAEVAQEFILNMFLKANKSSTKKIYHHFTCATDTNNISVVFDAVSDIIIEQKLAAIGFSGMA